MQLIEQRIGDEIEAGKAREWMPGRAAAMDAKTGNGER